GEFLFAFHGLSMQNNRAIAIFDFDGTLVGINSFPVWILFILKKSILNARFDIFIKILFLIFRRKLIFGFSHLEFKERLVLLINGLWASEFADSIRNDKNIVAWACMERHLQGGDLVVISSAAPLDYLNCFFEDIS